VVGLLFIHLGLLETSVVENASGQAGHFVNIVESLCPHKKEDISRKRFAASDVGKDITIMEQEVHIFKKSCAEQLVRYVENQ